MLELAHRFKLLGDIASGLQYLHSFKFPVIHGDLTSKNVLIDEDYNARLTDFGLASVIAGGEMEEDLAYLQMSIQRAGAVRYAAPELVSFSENLEGKIHFTTKMPGATIKKLFESHQESAAPMSIDESLRFTMSIYESPSPAMSVYASPSPAMSVYASPVYPGMDVTGSTFTSKSGPSTSMPMAVSPLI
ncbi:hypothetical protein HYDPIDRAFT_29333 [Hydnomerulius pinastri MD-312]|uniref:Protein kinase domain-containing protein n=1 Tax=Hydnomerulius pinastri MD-312 TaxID=994086 RepID=A0A0C9WE18_9AGAM|nr:hypothetical protein HYDPIDRAFT_29333 [Hydnomerulius pinastri MD-312]